MTRWRLEAKRRARIGALLLIGVATLYELGVNVALSAGWIAHVVSRDPETLRLSFARARSFWPGHVHVEGLDLRSRSSTIEWQLHIDSADADISLLALLHHRFHTGRVAANGVSFRLRFRLDPNALNADRAARLPPIDGFDEVPLLGRPPDAPPGSGKPWTVDVRGVDAQRVREVWIDAFRLEGTLRAMGGFTIGEGQLDVGPASALIDSVALTTGQDVIASHVEGIVDARLTPVNLDEVKGLAVLQSLTMSSMLQGEMGSVHFLQHFLPSGAVALEGGAGTFHGTTNVVRGVVTTGTMSHAELEPLRVRIAGRTLETRLRLDLTTGNTDEHHAAAWTAVEVGLTDVTFTDVNAKHPAATCRSIAASLQSEQLDLTHPLGLAPTFAYSWQMPRLEIKDARAIDAALPADAPVRFEQSTGQLASKGEGSLEGLRAESSLDGTVTMVVDGARVTSSVKGTVPLRAGFATRSLDFSGADLTLHDPSRSEWWARVKVGTASVHLEPPKVSLVIAMTARDGAPFLAFYSSTKKASLAGGAALKILPTELAEKMTANLSGGVRLTASKGSLDLRDLDVKGASSRLRGVLRRRNTTTDGGLLLEAGPTAVGISFEAGKTDLVLLEPTKWFETKVAPESR
jgi:hypothetical protein